MRSVFLWFFCSVILLCSASLLGSQEEHDFFRNSTFALEEGAYIGRITISDYKQGISEATYLYVKAAVEDFRKRRPAYVIVELNTPGGEVFAAQRIANLLRSLDTNDGIPVIAYVNNWAISAGAMLAYSCRYIVVSPDASMGAATPVIQTAEGMGEAPEKVNSALRSDFANRAAFFGRNPYIAKAMVDADLILVEREGAIVELSSEEDIERDGPSRDRLISAKGKLLTLTADEMIELRLADYRVSKQIARGPREFFPKKEVLGQTDLRELPGFVEAPEAVLETFEMDTKTSIVAFLVRPSVVSVLFFIAFVGIYFELSAPGFGLPGIAGGLAVLLLITGSFAQEAITWFEPICLVLGIALVALELIAFPMFGLLMTVGGALGLYGLFSILMPGLSSVQFDGGNVNAAGRYVLERLTWLSAAFLAGLAAIVVIYRRFPLHLLHSSGIVLEDTAVQEHFAHPVSVGDTARVVSALRPSGKIECQGVLYDALGRGPFVEKGEQVRVVKVRSNVIEVEAI